MGFDNITETAAALFGRVLEEGPPTTKVLHSAWAVSYTHLTLPTICSV